jgi:hypothetical protein
MELIQIIYDILLYGGTLLVCVIIISYLLSRSRNEEEVYLDSVVSSSTQKSLLLQSKINYEQELFRKKISTIIEEEVSSDSNPNQKSLSLKNKINHEQELFQKKILSIPPLIYPIDVSKTKEIKIIRKPTVSKRDTQEKIRNEEKYLNKTNGNGKRYTIVNNDMEKREPAQQIFTSKVAEYNF